MQNFTNYKKINITELIENFSKNKLKYIVPIILLIFIAPLNLININISIFNVGYILIFTAIISLSYYYNSIVSGIISIFLCFLLSLKNEYSNALLLSLIIPPIVCEYINIKSKYIFGCIFFISFSIICFLTTTIELNIIYILNCILSNIVFIFLPYKKNFTIKEQAIKEQSATYTENLKLVTSNKLNTYAYSFEKLSKTFEKLSKKQNSLEQFEINNLIDNVVSQVCIKCCQKNICWNENFYNTYQNIIDMLINKENILSFKENNLSSQFSKICIDKNKFIDCLNKNVEIYNLNLMWKNKLVESRQVVAQQLCTMSNIINQLSYKLDTSIKMDDGLALKIKKMLLSQNINAYDVIITENFIGKTEVLLKVEPCYVPNKCSRVIIPIVNSVLNKKMCRENLDCIIKKHQNKSVCYIKLVEEKKFRVKSTTVSSHKFSSKESGDSHTSIDLPDGKYLIAISDGMGSGANAKSESLATIELLEDFLNAGFTKEATLNTINSALFLKSSNESFATLDMCLIDLYKGVAEFIKIGGVSSFLIRKEKVEVLKCSSLPVGILNNLEPEPKIKKLQNQDIIVMISDGVYDSKEYSINSDEWILNFLTNLNTSNVNEIANLLFEETRNNYNNKLKDDITIIVSKVWSVS